MGVRALLGAISCLLLCTSIQAFDLAGNAQGVSFSDIPPCGVSCLFLTIPKSSCRFLDTECQCKNQELAHALSSCMLANCTMADILNTARVQDEICGLSEASKSRDLLIYTPTTYTVAFVFVVLRIVGKLAVKRFALDDWIIITSILLAVVPVGCILRIAKIGFGQHLWNLEPGQLLQNLRLFYVAWSAYLIVLALIKISLVIFYLDIFTSPRARIVSYIILTYIIINTLVIFCLTIFNCLPVRAFWNRDVKGKCLDINALGFANAASAILQDIILLIFPLVCVRSLNMKRKRKIAVGLMFTIGTLGWVATIIRLQALLSFKRTIDPTWDYVPVTIWTEIELACGFVCVSLPATRLLLLMLLPKSFSLPHRWANARASTSTSVLDKPQKKPVSWMHMSTTDYASAPPSRPRRCRLGSRHMRKQSHHRLGSVHGREEHINLSHVATRTPPVKPEKRRMSLRNLRVRANELAVPRTRQVETCRSCGSEGGYVTALPRLGCLPDESFSKEDLRRGGTGPGRDARWWEAV